MLNNILYHMFNQLTSQELLELSIKLKQMEQLLKLRAEELADQKDNESVEHDRS